MMKENTCKNIINKKTPKVIFYIFEFEHGQRDEIHHEGRKVQ